MTREELLRKWVEALESGKYEQTSGTLRREDSYCCLGVLCDVSGRGKWSPAALPSSVMEFQTPDGESYHMYLPSTWRDEFGMPWNMQRDLTNANDRGETFKQIARRIRKMFPDVFAEQVA